MTPEVEFAPLRDLDDFILESARFQLPNIKNPEKWANRVLNNLLYYQTNYFITSILVFLIVGLIHPAKMLCGMMAISIAFGLFFYISNTKRAMSKFKKDHPLLSLSLIFGGGYLLVYMLGSVLVFLFGIILPICLVFIHATLRLRNLRNKINNKIESIGLLKTPMGLFLETFSLQPSGIME